MTFYPIRKQETVSLHAEERKSCNKKEAKSTQNCIKKGQLSLVRDQPVQGCPSTLSMSSKQTPEGHAQIALITSSSV